MLSCASHDYLEHVCVLGQPVTLILDDSSEHACIIKDIQTINQQEYVLVDEDGCIREYPTSALSKVILMDSIGERTVAL